VVNYSYCCKHSNSRRWDSRDGASRRIDRCTVHRADVQCDQQLAIGRRLWTALATSALPPGAVNTRPAAVAVYIALADGGRAVAKFSKSKCVDKVQAESTLIFGDTVFF